MSYTAVGRNKVYASIEDLPENQKLVNGDRILIQTEEGTALVDYENVKIDLAHTTFGTQITSLVQFTSAVESFVNQIESDFTLIQQESVAMKNDINEIKLELDACKLMFKFVMGSVNGVDTKLIQKQVDNTLTGAGRAFYDQCLDAVKSNESTFSFRDWNLLG